MSRKGKKEWVLESLNISVETYGDKKGQYKGMIKFQTGVDSYETESICLKIPQEKLQKYKDFIAEDLQTSCDKLVNDLQSAFLGKNIDKMIGKIK